MLFGVAEDHDSNPIKIGLGTVSYTHLDVYKRQLYFTQLLGMALGLSAKTVGVNENLSDPRSLLREKGLG